MNDKKEACPTLPQDSLNNSSERTEDKEELQSRNCEPLNPVDSTVDSHAVIATLPGDVDALGSTNQIHVQLFDGQVIQITSASLVSSESRGQEGARRKGCEGEEKRDGKGGILRDEVTAEESVTLLTSIGETYILPHPINSEDGTSGGYLFAKEVISPEEVLQSSDVLHEEQVLKISPPQSSLGYPSSITTPPDALAIATSEVFNEDYVSLPLDAQNGLSGQSKPYELKAEERANSENSSAVDKEFVHTTIDHQRENASFVDCSVITIHAPNTRLKNDWLTKNNKEYDLSPILEKRDIYKMNDVQTYTIGNEDSDDPLAVNEKGRIPKAAEDSVKHMNTCDPCTYSSVFSKWCVMHNGIPKDCANNFHLSVNSLKKLVMQGAKDIDPKELNEGQTKEVVCQEKDKRTQHSVVIESRQSLDKNWDDVESVGNEMADHGRLRRSSRIRKPKKIPNEDQYQHGEESASRRRRKAMKGEANCSLWECDSCDAMFRSKVSRDRHMEEGHMFTCYVCGWQGRSKIKYEVHISTVHCNQQARCLACRKDFSNYEVYKQHMKTVHIVSTAVAVKIEKEDEPRAEEIQQQREHGNKEGEEDPDDPDYKVPKAPLGKDDDFHSYGERGCPYCGKQFHRRSRLLRHLNYHLGNKTFLCTFCTKSFVEKSGLDAHLQTHCPINETCPQCGKVFKTHRTMKRHLRTHENKTYSCEFCGKEFRHEESLRVHKSVHREGGSGNICSVCEKDCKTPYYLQLHMTTKHEAAKFLCLHCDRSFKWKQSYIKHKAIHHENRKMKYKCPLCPRHFMTTTELRVHQVVHTDERKYQCDICGKAFKHEYTRDKHIKTVHQENREHMCPQCGSLFKAKAYLDQHLAHVHTTKERVKCMQCGHDFKTEANLRSHIKVVHKPRNPKYTCKTCNKMFMAPKDLARHSKVHMGVKDHACPKCGRNFSRKDNMAAHLRTHTTDQPVSSFDPKTDLVTSGVPQQNTQGMSQIVGLPSTASSSNSISLSNIPVSSNNIILSSVPVSSNNIVISSVPPSNNIVLSSVPASDNIALTNVSVSSHTTSTTDTTISSNISLSDIPISATNVLSNMPSSSHNIILSNIPTASVGMSSVPTSTNPVVFSSTPTSNNLVFSNIHSSSGSVALCYGHSNPTNLSLGNISLSKNLVLSNSPALPNNVILHNPAPSSRNQTDHQVHSIHPHIISSTQHQTSTVSSLLPSSLSSSIISHPTSSAPVVVTEANRTQMVCSSFQPEQVVLTTEVLSPVSTVSSHHSDNSPQYRQLDAIGTSVSSGPAVNMNATLNSLGTSVASDPASLGGNISLSVSESHHNVTGVSNPVESSIILPNSSILQETALILPEKVQQILWKLPWNESSRELQ